MLLIIYFVGTPLGEKKVVIKKRANFFHGDFHFSSNGITDKASPD